MKRFKFSLQTLHELRERAREEAESKLSQAHAKVAQAEAALEQAQLARNLALENNAHYLSSGQINSHEVAMRADYIAVLDRRIAEAWQQLNQAQIEREARMREAVKAAMAAEATAKLREKHRARHESEVARTEQEWLDELATLASARRRTEVL
ncbi:MAG TPA: flagellar export protein FliJ [Blastocatellia bacterium]|nr:flagellar export protein FliJ [Blastocatellia bacterium]